MSVHLMDLCIDGLDIAASMVCIVNKGFFAITS
jgi:hypothetical protein